MNGRQAARMAAKRIEELEYANKLYAVDVKALYAVIDEMTQGKTPCDWCDEQEECDKQEKGGLGCTDFLLMENKQEGEDDEEGSDGSVDGAAVLSADDIRRTGGDCLGDLPADKPGEHPGEGVGTE